MWGVFGAGVIIGMFLGIIILGILIDANEKRQGRRGIF